MKEPIVRGISFPKETFEEMEQKRGWMPRSVFVTWAVKQALKRELPGRT